MEELCGTNLPPPHKHPHSCHSNPSPRSRFSSPVVFHTFCLYTFSLSLFTSLRGLRAGALAVPLGGTLHAQAQRRRPTLLPPRLYESQRGGALCVPSSCLPLSPCLCCLIPAADGHQARLFQLTLGCINNGLLYALSSTDAFELHAERKRRLEFACFINTDRSLNSPNRPNRCYTPLNFRFHQPVFLNEQESKKKV